MLSLQKTAKMNTLEGTPVAPIATLFRPFQINKAVNLVLRDEAVGATLVVHVSKVVQAVALALQKALAVEEVRANAMMFYQGYSNPQPAQGEGVVVFRVEELPLAEAEEGEGAIEAFAGEEDFKGEVMGVEEVS